MNGNSFPPTMYSYILYFFKDPQRPTFEERCHDYDRRYTLSALIYRSPEGRRLSKSEEAIDQDFISVMYGEVLPYYLHMVCTAKKLFGRENTNFI